MASSFMMLAMTPSRAKRSSAPATPRFLSGLFQLGITAEPRDTRDGLEFEGSLAVHARNVILGRGGRDVEEIVKGDAFALCGLEGGHQVEYFVVWRQLVSIR
jgi:hypothetical protein